MLRRETSQAVDIVRDATELIALETFRPRMSRQVERGERFPRGHPLGETFPQHFGLLLPLSELQEVQ